jgi:hypothetical protein
MRSLFELLLGQPKTYIPLLVIIITWGLDGLGLGVDITPEFKDALTVVMGAFAAALLRRGMVKEKDMNQIIEAKVEKRLDTLLDNIAEAKKSTDEAIEVDRQLLAKIRKEMEKIEVGGVDASEIAEYMRLKKLEGIYGKAVE